MGKRLRFGYVLSLLVVVAMFVAFAVRQWNETQLEFHKTLEIDAHLMAVAMESKLDQYALLADSLSDSLQRNPSLLSHPATLAERLREAQLGVSGVVLIQVIGSDGHTLGSTLQDRALPDMRNYPRSWAALLEARKFKQAVIGPVSKLGEHGQWILPIRKAYEAKGDAPAFWIVVGLDREAFSSYWADMFKSQRRIEAFEQEQAFAFARQDGYILAIWPDVQDSHIGDFYRTPQTGALGRSLQAKPGYADSNFQGVVNSTGLRRIGFWSRLNGRPDLVVAVSLLARKVELVYLRKLLPAVIALLLVMSALTVTYFMVLQRLRAEGKASRDRHDALLAYNEQLRDLAEKDYLTNLPNRRYLMSRLAALCSVQSESPRSRFAVATLDLDNFKQVNDSRGHAMGDRFLKALSKRLQKALRDDDLLVRLGGDEFAVLLPVVGQGNDAMGVCRRLLDRARGAVEISEHDAVHVTASMGLALYPDDGNDPETLLRHADQAMYAAKMTGKNKLLRFSPEMDQAAHAKQYAFDLLREALVERWLSLYYQPVVGVSGRDTGRIQGMEALLRVKHPLRGLVPAHEFFSALDTPQLARPVGCWVLQHALDQAQIWIAEGLDFQVMINISALHFLDPAWLDDLSDAIDAHPLVRPGRIKIEITESAALHDLDRAGEIMQASIAMGVRFALDDFGQGETALRYLQLLPAHTIKIDRSFVCNMIDDPRDYAIVSGLLNMATLMGLTCVAEGVENLDTVNLLASHGCSYVQGYGIARPMPAAEVSPWVQAWKPPAFTPALAHARPNLPEIQRQRFARLTAAAHGKTPFPGHLMNPDADQRCHLGMWLNGAGQYFYGEDGRYPDFHRRHNLIHELIRRAKVVADAGNLPESQRLVKEAEDINNALMDELERLILTPRT